jgi:predicted amidophosphoribosyltransferase
LHQDDEAAEDSPRLARKSPFAPTVKLCPKCLKPLQRGSRLGGWLVPQDYFCPECGYQGTVFVEKDLDLKRTEKEQS